MSSVKHIAPERWALLDGGTLVDSERAAMLAHAEGCPRCAAERTRILAARAAMADLRRAEPPGLSWELLGARLNWTVQSELRAREREREQRGVLARRRWSFLALGVGLAAAVAGLVIWQVPTAHAPKLSGLPHADERPAPVAPAPVAPAPIAPAPAPVALEGIITLAAGEVALDGQPLAPDAAVRAGSRLVTGKGRVHVQFGTRSGFVLEPRSVLEVIAFDSHSVELRVDGAIGLEVTHREPGQTFAVVSGGRRVEVRGTVFRVAGGQDGLKVAVTRGRVAVLDGAEEIDVPAGSALDLPLAAGLAGFRPRPMSDPEAVAMAERLHVSMLTAFPDAAAARRESSLLKVAAPRNAQVQVDGVPAGTGPLFVRVSPGRHMVAAGGDERWVEVELGTVIEQPVGIGKLSERAGQVKSQAEKYRSYFETCANRARSIDPAFTANLDVLIDINADGTVNAVYAVKGISDHDTEDCVVEVIRQQFSFPAGTPGSVRQKIKL